MLAPGTVVDQKFEIVSAMAMGGFGIIYRAKQLGFDRIVALKVLQSHADIDAEDIRRFEREARILSQLRHRNLVMFYGFGVYEGHLYIAMEMIQGKSLEVRLARSGRLPFAEAIPILKQVCEALMCAHSHGVVHRDLKPTNIMLCETPDGLLVKLIDFGLATLITADVSEMQKITAAGNTVGSVEYMSPEQCIGRAADDRCDIYSLGCVLHHCLTGEPPFTGDSGVVVMRRHVDDAPPRLAELIKGQYPTELQYVIDKALAKDPDDRYEDIGEFLADLEVIEQRTGGKLIADRAPVARRRKIPRMSTRGLLTKVSVIVTAAIFAIAFVGAFAQYLKLAFPEQLRTTSIDAWNKVRLEDRGRAEDYPARREAMQKQYARVLDLNNDDHLLDRNQVAQVCYRLALLHERSEHWKPAQNYSRKALELFIADNELSRDAQNCCYTLMNSADKMGELKDELPLLQRMANTSPKKGGNIEARVQLAQAYEMAYEYQSALDVLNKVKQEMPPDSRPYKAILTEIEVDEAKLKK